MADDTTGGGAGVLAEAVGNVAVSDTPPPSVSPREEEEASSKGTDEEAPTSKGAVWGVGVSSCACFRVSRVCLDTVVGHCLVSPGKTHVVS